jgi:hypothetical protein
LPASACPHLGAGLVPARLGPCGRGLGRDALWRVMYSVPYACLRDSARDGIRSPQAAGSGPGGARTAIASQSHAVPALDQLVDLTPFTEDIVTQWHSSTVGLSRSTNAYQFLDWMDKIPGQNTLRRAGQTRQGLNRPTGTAAEQPTQQRFHQACAAEAPLLIGPRS